MLRKSIFAVAAACILSLAAALLLALPGAAEDTRAVQAPTPAIWKIDGPNGQVYLFGSIHILPRGYVWRTPALEAALAASQQLVFELDIEDVRNPLFMMGITSKYGILPKGGSLHRMLAPERREQLDAAIKSLGLDPARFDRMRPWLAAMTLVSRARAQANAKPGEALQPSEGVQMVPGDDSQLWDYAKGANKDRGALETADDQMRVFADLTPDEEVAFLVVSLDEVSKPASVIAGMIEAWRTGDTAGLEKILNSGMNRFPSLRKAILHNRHVKWVPQIERMIGDGRTHLIVVGAAHLVGQDSVIAMLRAKGIKVEGP